MALQPWPAFQTPGSPSKEGTGLGRWAHQMTGQCQSLKWEGNEHVFLSGTGTAFCFQVEWWGP